jgi:integrase
MNTSLSLPRPPYYDTILSAPNLQPSTQAKYIRELDLLLSAGIDPMDRPALLSYAHGLSRSSRAFLKAALRFTSKEHITNLQASATATNLPHVQAQLLNLEAMNKTIAVHKVKGTKTHTWLSREQVEQITALPDTSTIRGQRDYIVLALLLGAGLRREELSSLTWESLKSTPARGGFRHVLDVTGKGNKSRAIPISDTLARHLLAWQKVTGPGNVVRSINKAGRINGHLSPIGVHNIVRQYGALIGIPELDSHDLRRTYAMIGFMAGVPITQVSQLLGHASVRTTQTYLNLEIDLESTISDFIPLSGD